MVFLSMQDSFSLQFPFILASNSPRRREILSQAGFQFSVLPSDVDESFPLSMPAQEVPVMLAERKAKALWDSCPNTLILSADTVVILAGEILNKPVDKSDALHMLKSFPEKHTKWLRASHWLVRKESYQWRIRRWLVLGNWPTGKWNGTFGAVPRSIRLEPMAFRILLEWLEFKNSRVHFTLSWACRFTRYTSSFNRLSWNPNRFPWGFKLRRILHNHKSGLRLDS